MCLVLLAWKTNPHFPLIVAANRDEFYQRPTEPVHWWGTDPDVLAGRDVTAGGTWMGVTTEGRFAAVTNYRDGVREAAARSRGELTSGFLLGRASPGDYANSVKESAGDFAGFSLLISDGQELWCVTNKPTVHVQRVQPGVHGLSNGELNEPWPKVTTGIAALSSVAERDVSLNSTDDYMNVLADRTAADPAQLPTTGVGEDFEYLLSSRFIHFDSYGTRSSSVLKISADGALAMAERRFDSNGEFAGQTDVRYPN
ncbi:NRDE family protein [Hoyosella rhizosphaerae]|uniref:NRDE family protein n=1 Tax=Hoyosella rhizosphaerae TaxID=1755582 RepID=A0A916XAN3_9ACTN|nr:NRDE family protein [Hoyosella rhizosphaerae]MBN4926641.1 NRDE family protein [Hoyosella rhizosphaerae]GGC57614.1 hypothetical protein GCM10011410_07670 [Hoyosella rhizosphaerae]